jgi:hypothetical protein
VAMAAGMNQSQGFPKWTKNPFWATLAVGLFLALGGNVLAMYQQHQDDRSTNQVTWATQIGINRELKEATVTNAADTKALASDVKVFVGEQRDINERTAVTLSRVTTLLEERRR